MILGFKKQFIPKVIDGSKPHSLREGERWKAGMTIHFYGNVRQASMYKFMPDKECVSTQKVLMTRDSWLKIKIDKRDLLPHEIEEFIKRDGFEDTKSFISFFFWDSKEKAWANSAERQLVHWTDLRY